MKVVLENKEELHAMEERIKKAVDCVLESNSKLRSSERKLIRSQLTQLTSCLTLKVFTCTAPPRPRHAACSALHAWPHDFFAFYLLHCMPWFAARYWRGVMSGDGACRSRGTPDFAMRSGATWRRMRARQRSLRQV
jgi:hypothetical protein